MREASPEVTWLLEIHHDFTDPERMIPHVGRHVLLDTDDLRRGKVPQIEGPVVAYGRFKCLTHLLGTSLSRAVFDDYRSLQCSIYYRHLYPYLHRMAVLIPMIGLTEMNPETVFGKEFFVRPDSNKKPFEAKKVSVDTLGDYLASHRNFHHDLVVVSEVISIAREFRCFCREGKVFASSAYPPPDIEVAPPAVIEFSEEVAQTVLQSLGMNMISVDVAVDPDGKCRLIEIGGVNSWGIYGVDENVFAKALEAEAREVQSWYG